MSLHDAILAWAHDFVRANPTRSQVTYTDNPEGRGLRAVTTTIPNTTEHVLAELLHQHFSLNTDDRSGWEMACDWAMSGVKGYAQMDRDELLAAVEGEILDNHVSSGCLDLDDHVTYADLSTAQKVQVFYSYLNDLKESTR